MNVALIIEPDSAMPPYEQVRSQLLEAIAASALAPGTRLPTVRGLAAQLRVAAGTVARAYRELESSGVVETRGRKGTFVSLQGDAVRQEAQRAALAYANQIRALEVDPAEALVLVDTALRATGQGSGRAS